jgi:7-cyano-7-deazaguanine synthase
VKRAVVLLSGGLDSATCLAVARAEGFELHALTVDYGQRHAREVEQAARVARAMGATHRVVRMDLRAVGGSALTDAGIAVPKDRPLAEIQHGIPATYVPARNTALLALALGFAETLGAEDIYFGANVLDATGYPDCRPEYVRAFESLAQLATAAGVEGRAHYRIHTPLITLAKAEIIRRGLSLGVDYASTHSCYDPTPEGLACGRCDTCALRKKGFQEAGVPDPTRYA